jgi:alkylhydroperoxidase family enzyme
MARVTLIDEARHPELAALVERIRGARGGRLLNLYRALLHSAPLAEAWLAFNDAVRRPTGLNEASRELVILYVALLNGADYVFEIHASRYAADAGLGREQVTALANWRASDLFGPRQRALLAYVDAMTREVVVPDAVFDALRAHFDERGIVELTVLVGAYNMHTRVLMALAVDPEGLAANDE